MIIERHYHPNSCFILPTIFVSAGVCEDCAEIHGWQIAVSFLWWGITASWESDWEDFE
jgi:tellurite resistance protein TehA-like permease